VLYERDRVVIRLGSKARESLATLLITHPREHALALLTEIDESADGCYVWEPGQSQPVAVTPPNSRGARLAGCFLAFLPEQETDTVRIVEDGVVLMITNITWETLRRGISHGEPVRIIVNRDRVSIDLECFDDENR
jgi:hypothetical protein